MADTTLSQAEAQRQAQLQAARDAAKMAERRRVAGLGVKAPAEIAVATKSISTQEQLADTVLLSNGDRVNKDTFYSLGEADQALLMERGVKGFNSYYAELESKFKAGNVQLKDETWVSKELYDSLAADDQSLLYNIGVEEFNKMKETEFQAFKLANVQLGDGSWISKESYNNLPQDWQVEIFNRGVNSFNNWLPTAYGGATEYIEVNGKIYGTTQSVPNYPYQHQDNIALDVGGNRVYVGGRWPSSANSAAMGVKNLVPGWPEEVKSFNVVTLPERQGVTTVYVGAASVLGGEWGITPEALAVQKLGGNVIKFEGASEYTAQKMVDEAIRNLTPEQKKLYEAELEAIQATPGTTMQEKLQARNEFQVLQSEVAVAKAQYEKLGAKLEIAWTEEGKSTAVVQLKTGELMLRQDFDKLSEEKQKLVVKKGYSAIYTKTSKGEYIENDMLAAMPEKYQDILLKQGFEAYQKVFEAEHVQIKKTGEWLDKKSFESLSEPQQKYIQENGSVALAKQQDSILSVLETGYKQEDGYDISKYLRDYPENKSALLLVGFEEKDIREAVEWNEKPFVKETQLEKYLDKVNEVTGLRKDLVLGDKYTFEKLKTKSPALYAEGMSLLKKIEAESNSKDAAGVKAPVSVNQFIADFMSVRGLEPLSLTEITRDKERTLAQRLAEIQYANTYGAVNLASSRLATAAEFLFVPAKALHPEVTIKDVRAIDWAVGGAQIALLLAPAVAAPLRTAAPMIARGIGTGINAVSGMIFTAATIKDWNEMKPADKTLAAIVDTYLIASTLLEFRGIHLPKRTTRTISEATSKSAQAAVKITGENKLYPVLADIRKSIATRNVKLLQSAGQKLELVGRKVPKELGGQELVRRGRLLKAAPDDYISLKKIPNSGDEIEKIVQSIDDNLTFIDRAEDMLKKVRKAERREILEEKVKLAKEQVAAKKKQLKLAEKEKLSTVTDIKVEDALRRMEEIEKLRKEGKLALIEAEKLKAIRAVAKPKYKPRIKAKEVTKVSPKPAEPGVKRAKVSQTFRPEPRQASRAAPHIGVVWAVGTPLPSDSTKLVVSPAISPLTRTVPEPLTTTRVKTEVAKPSTETQVVVRTSTATLPLELTETETKTKPAPAPVVQTVVKKKLAPYPLTKTQTKSKLAPYPVTKTATETPTKPTPVIRIPLPDGKGYLKLTKEQVAGIVAWKQGKLKGKGGKLFARYIAKWPDSKGNYPVKNTINTSDPIEGVHYEEGIGSVAKSIIKKYGEIPKDLEFSMGIQNVKIYKDKTPGIQKPKIKFTLKSKYRKGRGQKKHEPSLAGMK